MNSTRLARYGLFLLLHIYIPLANSETTTQPSTDEQEEVVELDTVTVEGEADEGDKLYNAKFSTSATRTDTPIKAIPQSVQVVTRKLINDQQNVTVSETLRNVSGLIPNNVLYTPAVESTRIRGFRAEQLLDGFTQYYNPGDRESTNNLERIEVLKGSNAVLYSGGSGSPVGGVVNMVSKLPKSNAFGQFGMKLGTEAFYQPSIDVNQPINDKVLTRFTGEYTNAGSFLDVVETERYNLNEAITFTNNDSTNFTIQGRIAKWQQQGYQGLPATGTVAGDFKIRPELFIGPKDIPLSHSDYYGIWATLDHWFNETWSVNAKARYSESEFNEMAQSIRGEGQNFTAEIPIQGSIWGLANTELFQQQVENSFLFNVLAQFDYWHSQNKVLFGADYSKFDDQGFTTYNRPDNAFIDLLDPNPQFLPYTKTWTGDDGFNQQQDGVKIGEVRSQLAALCRVQAAFKQGAEYRRFDEPPIHLGGGGGQRQQVGFFQRRDVNRRKQSAVKMFDVIIAIFAALFHCIEQVAQFLVGKLRFVPRMFQQMG